MNSHDTNGYDKLCKIITPFILEKISMADIKKLGCITIDQFIKKRLIRGPLKHGSYFSEYHYVIEQLAINDPRCDDDDTDSNNDNTYKIVSDNLSFLAKLIKQEEDEGLDLSDVTNKLFSRSNSELLAVYCGKVCYIFDIGK